MATYEPELMREWCLNHYSGSERAKEAARWSTSVAKRINTWKGSRKSQSVVSPQLEWQAEVCEYVQFLSKLTRPPARSGLSAVPLPPSLPLLGPRFIPPSFIHTRRRQSAPEITPDAAYLKPLTVIHPLYYPELLTRCPNCRIAGTKSDISWNGWTSTGPREVHGLMMEEAAIGIQLRCKTCEAKFAKDSTGKGASGSKLASGSKPSVKGAVSEESEEGSVEGEGKYCFGLTNHLFWKGIEHWEVPAEIPHFFKRCAVTAELYDLVVEMRPSATSAGLAENVRQLHLLTYHKQRMAYLQHYNATRPRGQLTLPGVSRTAVPLRNFSKPKTSIVSKHVDGYDNRSISDDLITYLYSKFVEETRQAESEDSLRVKTAVTISLDATFKTAYKATIVENDKTRTKSHKGGIVTVINEKNAVMAWRYCLGQGHTEIREALQGVKERHEELGVADPEVAVVDNCCHIKGAIVSVFPNIAVVLDVWHFMMRYMICIVNGTKNPHRAEVAHDLVDAIVKSTANDSSPAVYRSQAEQEERLQAVFDKWAAKGGVWSAAAAKTHHEQLAHVQKGCLARPRNDVRSDGSRIEGVHKGFNHLQRSFASGLVMMTLLLHDYILRRNMRVEFASSDATPFVLSTYGSHHVRLVNAYATLWNGLVTAAQRARTLPADIHPLPQLVLVNSRERFGLVKISPTVAAQQSFATIKEEPEDDPYDLSAHHLLDADHVLNQLGIDPSLLHLPLSQRSSSTPAMSKHPVVKSISAPRKVQHSVGVKPLSVAAPVAAQADDEVVCLDKGKGVDRSQAVSHKRSRILDDDELISMREEDWEMAAIVQQSSSLSLDRSAFASSSPAPTDMEEQWTSPYLPNVPIFSQDPVSSPRAPTSSHLAAAAADAPPSFSLSRPQPVEGPPPKKKARLHVAGTPSGSLSSHHASATPRSGSQLVAASGSAGSSTGVVTAPVARLNDFFGPRRVEVHANSSVRPCVPAPTISGATPSQRLFSIATGIDSRSLSFDSRDDKEYYLFMELRALYKWASFNLSPFDWVGIASIYNTEIQALNRREGRAFINRTPRALMEFLGKMETKILARIARGDFKSADGKTDFWTRHCHAVPLTAKLQSRGEVNGKKKLRFNHQCSRCEKIMYPGKQGAPINHRKGVCSDGAWQKARTSEKVVNGQTVKIVDEPPQYPQPAGVFSNGDTFHPVAFLQEVQTLYERIIMRSDAVTMQDLAFASMLHQRTLTLPAERGYSGMVLFKLYPGLKVVGTFPESLLVDYDGSGYLRMDCLNEAAERGLAQG